MHSLIKLSLLIIITNLITGCDLFDAEVQSLLSAAEVEYKIKQCSYGSIERKISCEIEIAPDETEQLIQKFGLKKPIAGIADSTRFIYLTAGDCADRAKSADKIEQAFRDPLWNPSRNGFDGAFLIYYPKTQTGCLWLSIAYS